MARLEALLFVAREPLGTRKIAQSAGLADSTEARTLIRRLNDLYDVAGSAFRVEEVAGGYHVLTRPVFGPYLRRLLQNSAETRLSAPAMETLAVVAYRQPVLRVDIEAIRGVQCGDILRQLMERDLVRIAGRSNDLGRPLLYGTTKRFLELFGLKQLDELPRTASLSNSGAAHSVNDPGPGRAEEIRSGELNPEEKSVTTRIRSASYVEELSELPLAALAEAARRNQAPSVAAQADEEEADEDEDDDDWDDDDEDDDEEDDDEEDDFVDEEWEEVDDEEEELDEDEDEEDDEEWDDDEDEDEEWDDDEEEAEEKGD